MTHGVTEVKPCFRLCVQYQVERTTNTRFGPIGSGSGSGLFCFACRVGFGVALTGLGLGLGLVLLVSKTAVCVNHALEYVVSGKATIVFFVVADGGTSPEDAPN